VRTVGERGARKRTGEPYPHRVAAALCVAFLGGCSISHSSAATDDGGASRTASTAMSMSTAAPTSSAATDSGEPERISTQHFVVTDADSPMGQNLHIMRTRDEARARAQQGLARAKAGEDFLKVVVEYSDDPQASTNKGQLANYRRSDAMPAFADAAFKLKVGEISDVVDTPFGFMVIHRTK
jgi:hypothetical protein